MVEEVNYKFDFGPVIDGPAGPAVGLCRHAGPGASGMALALVIGIGGVRAARVPASRRCAGSSSPSSR